MHACICDCHIIVLWFFNSECAVVVIKMFLLQYLITNKWRTVALVHYKVKCMQPSHGVCKPAYLVPVPSQTNWEGCVRKGIRHENGGTVEVGAPISLDGVAVHPDCCCVCCVIFILLQKIQKMDWDCEKVCQARKLNREDAIDWNRWKKQIRDDWWPQ